MKINKFVWLAALVPAIALANPNRDHDQNKSDSETDIETETFEYSSGQAHLGVMVMGLTPELRAHFGAPRESGLLVARVDQNSAAARAGVRVGDVITKIDNDRVKDATDILGAVSQAEASRTPQANQPIAIEVVRDHATIDLQARLPAPRHEHHAGPGNQL